MYNASANFAAEILKSHTPVSKVEVKKRGKIYASTERDLYLLDGSVKADRLADVRRTANLTFVDVDGTKTPLKGAMNFSEIFNPVNGFEFDISRGVRYADGSTEYIPLGLFHISDLNIRTNQAGGYTFLELQLEDRSGWPNGKKFFKAVSNNYNTTPTWWAMEITYDFYPNFVQKEFDYGWIVVQFEAGGTTPIPTLTAGKYKFAPGDNPWQAAQTAVRDASFEFWFGRLGEPKMERVINPETQQVVRTFTDDQYSVFTTPPNRQLTLQDICTGVIVEGSAPWLIYPVRAELWDIDPRSVTFSGPLTDPTNWDGSSALGRIPYIITDAQATNTGRAMQIAQSEFYKRVGLVENVTFDCLPDPRLDVGDVIGLYESTSGTTGRVVLETLNIPLRADGIMTGTTRRRRRGA